MILRGIFLNLVCSVIGLQLNFFELLDIAFVVQKFKTMVNPQYFNQYQFLFGAT